MRPNLLSWVANGLAWRADKVLRPLAFRRYSVARLYTRATLALTRWERPVLVYTMGKVGSSSLMHSLQKAAPDLDVLHVHHLVSENLSRKDALYRHAAHRRRGTPIARMFRSEHVWLGQHLNGLIDRPPPHGGRWTIITLIRDPVARNTSAFFQNLWLIFGFDWAEELRSKPQGDVVSELKELFRGSYADKDWWSEGKDTDALTWFDEELRRAFGIDVFDEPFPREDGFKIYEGARAQVLLVRLEDLDRCAPAAMHQLLGLSGFQLHRRNVALDKGYALLYRAFLESMEFPVDYVDRLLGSRAARHFYSETELEEFRRRALRSGAGP